MNKIAENWQFTDFSYPAFRGLEEPERTERALGHVLLHLQKEVGKLAKVQERMDHGGGRDTRAEEEAVRDLVVCILRYAELRSYYGGSIMLMITEMFARRRVGSAHGPSS